MRIAVIADTHNRIPLHLLHKIADADEIWHLGDVTDASCLESVYDLGKPLHVVRGNGDWNEAWPKVLDVEREGFSIRLIHIPPLMAPPDATFYCTVTRMSRATNGSAIRGFSTPARSASRTKASLQAMPGWS